MTSAETRNSELAAINDGDLWLSSVCQRQNGQWRPRLCSDLLGPCTRAATAALMAAAWERR